MYYTNDFEGSLGLFGREPPLRTHARTDGYMYACLLSLCFLSCAVGGGVSSRGALRYSAGQCMLAFVLPSQWSPVVSLLYPNSSPSPHPPIPVVTSSVPPLSQSLHLTYSPFFLAPIPAVTSSLPHLSHFLPLTPSSHPSGHQ